MKTALIITTINKPNTNIAKFSKYCKINKWDFILVGDKKSPQKYNVKYGHYFCIKDQEKLNFKYSKICLKNSYTRKNIGYLIALKRNNEILIESDDDNYPKNNFFIKRKKTHLIKEISNNSWINIYDFFLKDK